MHVVITDLAIAACELTGKSEVECVRVRLDEHAPEAVIALPELAKLLRFKKNQQAKADASSVPVGKGATK